MNTVLFAFIWCALGFIAAASWSSHVAHRKPYFTYKQYDKQKIVSIQRREKFKFPIILIGGLVSFIVLHRYILLWVNKRRFIDPLPMSAKYMQMLEKSRP